MSLRSTLVACAAAVLLLAAGAARADAATACPATFQVLHDDAIGKLKLPAGPYTVAVSGLSCAAATELFADFLQDYDGVLPKPWKTTVRGSGRGSFSRGGGVSFSVTGADTPSGGGGGRGQGACPGAYAIRHADRLGSLVLKKGRYRLFLLSRNGRLSCAKATKLLTGFLEDFDGNLPGGWVFLPDSATFVKGSIAYGFRIKPLSGSGGSGGGSSTKEVRCGPTFRVLHDDMIGKLSLPGGPYRIDVRGMGCATASTRLRQFLAMGRPASGWALSVSTATFRKKGTKASFQVEPAFDAR